MVIKDESDQNEKKNLSYLISFKVCFVSGVRLLLSPARTWVTLGSAWAAWERVEWLKACKYVACTPEVSETLIIIELIITSFR